MVLLLQFTQVSLLPFFSMSFAATMLPLFVENVPWCPIESNGWVGHLPFGVWHPWNMSHPTSKQRKIHSKPGFSVKFWVESKVRYSISACISHVAKSKSTATVTCSRDISPTAVLTTISCQCRNLSWRVPWQQGDSLLVQRDQKRQRISNFGSCLLEGSL